MSLEIMTSVDLNQNAVVGIPDNVETVSGKKMHLLDAALNSTSSNPVQNKAIKLAIDALSSRIDGINVSIDNVTIKRNASDELCAIGAGYYVNSTLKGEVFNYNPNNTGNVASGANSHAEGVGTTASGITSHAEGNGTTASKWYAHAEGNATTASGQESHAEGGYTTASGTESHAEGYRTIASAIESHAEGNETTASGQAAHAEGLWTKATNEGSHAEGHNTSAAGARAHAEGWSSGVYDKTVHGATADAIYTYWTTPGNQIFTVAFGANSHVEGMNCIALAEGAHAEGNRTAAKHTECHSEGYETRALNTFDHSEGSYSVASGGTSHAEGNYTTASGAVSHAEGNYTTASGNNSHSEGNRTTASGANSHSEGNYTTASGNESHAEGDTTVAGGISSHAEGFNISAIGDYSHAEGFSKDPYDSDTHGSTEDAIYAAWLSADREFSVAFGETSHVEGANCVATGIHSHVEGSKNISKGTYSHAEGSLNKALGSCSHIEGHNNETTSYSSHAEGSNNNIGLSASAAHIEGINNTITEGNAIHVEGTYNTASGLGTHVSGMLNEVEGLNAFVSGSINTTANTDSYVAFTAGQRNIINSYSFALGENLVARDYHCAFGVLNSHNTGIPIVTFKTLYETDPEHNDRSLIYTQNYAIVKKDDEDNVLGLVMCVAGLDRSLVKIKITGVYVNGSSVGSSHFSLSHRSGLVDQPDNLEDLNQYFLIIDVDGFTIDPNDEYTIELETTGSIGDTNIFTVGNGLFADDEDCDSLHRANALAVTYKGTVKVQNDIIFKYKDSSDVIHKISAQKMVDALLSLNINIADLEIS